MDREKDLWVGVVYGQGLWVSVVCGQVCEWVVCVVYGRVL